MKKALFMSTYSKQELEEFKTLIQKKHKEAVEEYNAIQQQMNDNGTKDTDPVWINANFADETMMKEQLSLQASRIKKFIDALTAALYRVENGTYGVCLKTGQLIPKERLRAVPHATLSIDAKLSESKK
ncbi:MAG: TraR/DksA family transcriptional regulator [Bacteroidia bacterium]